MLADVQPPPQSQIHEITLHLARAEQPMKWWCINCRNFLFFSQERIITISQDGASEFLKPPITIICSKCRWQYHLQTLL